MNLEDARAFFLNELAKVADPDAKSFELWGHHYSASEMSEHLRRRSPTGRHFLLNEMQKNTSTGATTTPENPRHMSWKGPV
ncbi:hypothetical protein K2P96_00355, partial [Patescibacteria group bacterium]|nr:hypothetical protein [Patescibacteria group bacterium]